MSPFELIREYPGCAIVPAALAVIYIASKINAHRKATRQRIYGQEHQSNMSFSEILNHIQKVEGPVDLADWEGSIRNSVMHMMDPNFQHKIFKQLVFVKQYSSLGDMKNVKFQDFIKKTRARSFDGVHGTNFEAQCKAMEEEYRAAVLEIEGALMERDKMEKRPTHQQLDAQDRAQDAAQRARRLIFEIERFSQEIYDMTESRPSLQIDHYDH
ncbi:hypothetical protein M1328_04100 [Patescibacteria group bacterium]|nr:hypothetical protein [Patescibacteria group bacterium]